MVHIRTLLKLSRNQVRGIDFFVVIVVVVVVFIYSSFVVIVCIYYGFIRHKTIAARLPLFQWANFVGSQSLATTRQPGKIFSTKT